MPNWCENKLLLTVDNDVTILQNFILQNKTEENELSFQCSVPQPENIYKGGLGVEEREKYGINNWYDWNINNWGTKWDCNDIQLNNDNDSIN